MVTVPAAKNMDVVTFHKHLNLRHMPIDGMANIVLHPHEKDENGASRALRAYHKRLHETETCNHDHLEE